MCLCTLHADHLGPFTKTRDGNCYVLVVIDSFTKFVFAKPVRNVSSLLTIKKLKEVMDDFGNPTRVITERGVAFTSRYFKDFANERQFKHILNAVACPRANGQVERGNRTILDGLNTTTESECMWDTKLANVIWGINNTPHTITGFTPFSLMFSHSNSALQAYSMNSEDNHTLRQQLDTRRKKAKDRLDRQMIVMKNNYDR